MNLKLFSTKALWCVIACISTLFISCSNLTVSETRLEFDKYGGTRIIEVASDYSWTATVPENVEWIKVSPEVGINSTSVEITATPNDRLKERSTIVYFSAKGASIRVSVKQETSDATLKSINLSAGTLSPEFNPLVTSYSVNVEKTQETITIIGEPNDETTIVEGNGEIQLNSGDNTIYLTTLSETGSKMVYIITVRREPEAVLGEETITVDGVSFEVVRLEGGTFLLGATENQLQYAFEQEKPAHSVTLSSFGIGSTEVTQSLWLAVMGAHKTEQIAEGDDYPETGVGWYDIVGSTDDVAYSVNGVDYRADGFCSKLSEMVGDGRKFILPTEAQWEFAARGGNDTNNFIYSGSDSIGLVGWYDGNSGNALQPVARLQPNEIGIYDMSGNVYEWCSDFYAPYTADLQINPVGPAIGDLRSYRGGRWNFLANYCRVSYRNGISPSERYHHIGFRVVLMD